MLGRVVMPGDRFLPAPSSLLGPRSHAPLAKESGSSPAAGSVRIGGRLDASDASSW